MKIRKFIFLSMLSIGVGFVVAGNQFQAQAKHKPIQKIKTMTYIPAKKVTANKGYMYSSIQLTKRVHHMTNYKHTVFKSLHTVWLRKPNGKTVVYQYLKSNNGKVKGYVYGKYVKDYHKPVSKPANDDSTNGTTANDNSNQSTATTTTPNSGGTTTQTINTADGQTITITGPTGSNITYEGSGSASSKTPTKNNSSNSSSSNSSTSTNSTDDQKLPTFSLSEYRAAFLSKLNQERAQRNIAPLKENSTFDEIAQKRSTQLPSNFDHYDANGNFIADQLFKQHGMDIALGECVAEANWAPGNYEGLMNDAKSAAHYDLDRYIYHDAASNWGHRDALLNPNYNTIGMGGTIGRISGNSGMLFTAADMGTL